MELRLKLDDDFIETLKSDMGIKSAAVITNEALTLFRWAVSEVMEGRKILSEEESGNNVKRVVMPSLEDAKRKAKKRLRIAG